MNRPVQWARPGASARSASGRGKEGALGRDPSVNGANRNGAAQLPAQRRSSGYMMLQGYKPSGFPQSSKGPQWPGDDVPRGHTPPPRGCTPPPPRGFTPPPGPPPSWGPPRQPDVMPPGSRQSPRSTTPRRSNQSPVQMHRGSRQQTPPPSQRRRSPSPKQSQEPQVEQQYQRDISPRNSRPTTPTQRREGLRQQPGGLATPPRGGTKSGQAANSRRDPEWNSQQRMSLPRAPSEAPWKGPMEPTGGASRRASQDARVQGFGGSMPSGPTLERRPSRQSLDSPMGSRFGGEPASPIRQTFVVASPLASSGRYKMPAVPTSPGSEVSTRTGGPADQNSSAADQSSVPPGLVDNDSLLSGNNGPSARAMRRRKSPLQSRAAPVCTLPERRMSSYVDTAQMDSLTGIGVLEPSETTPTPTPRKLSNCSMSVTARATDGAQVKALFDPSSPLAGGKAEDFRSATCEVSPRPAYHAGATPRTGRIPSHNGVHSGLIDLEARRWCNLSDHVSRTFSSDLVKGAFLDEDEKLKGAIQQASEAESKTWNAAVGRKAKIETKQSLSTWGPKNRKSLPVFEEPKLTDGSAGQVGGHQGSRKTMRRHVGDANRETLSVEVAERFALPAPPMLDSTWRNRESTMIKGDKYKKVERMFPRKGKEHSPTRTLRDPISWDLQPVWGEEERAASAPPPMETGWNPVTNEFGRTMRGQPRMTAFAAEGDNGPAFARHVVHGRQEKLMQHKSRPEGADPFCSPGVEPCITMSPVPYTRHGDERFQQRCRETQIARRDVVNEGISVRSKVHRSNSHDVHQVLQWT